MAPPPLTPPHEPSVENLLLRFGLVTLDQLGAAMREQTETGTPFTDVLVRDGVVSAADLARVQDRTPAPAPEAPAEDAPEPPTTPAFRDDVSHAPDGAEPPAPVVARLTATLDPRDDVSRAADVAPEPPALVAAAVAAAPAPGDDLSQARAAAVPAPEAVVQLAPPPVLRDEPAQAPAPPAPAPVVTGYVVRGRLVNGDEIEIASVEQVADAQRIARDAMRACARPDGDWPILSGRYVRPDSIVSIEVAESF